MPVSANITPSEIRRVVDVNQIKRIHFGRVAIFSSTGLLIALVEFRPFTTMSEVEVNQWDELSQFLFRKKRFTDPIATNGALLEGFMFAIGWRKCSTKNEQFGLYGSVGKIENAKDEWRNRGANLSSVGCILGQSLQYVGDNLFEKIQNFYKSLGVPSFDQVNYEANMPANQGAFEFASALTFTMNGFKNAPHVDKDASLYASGWWFQADKRTGQIQRDASKQCTGGKLIFPNEHFWIDLSACHGLIQVVWASSTFVHYTDPAQDNESTTLVGMSAQCSSRGEVDYVRWNAIIHISWFVAPVQDADASHTNPYACAGSNNAKSSLCLCGVPTLHTPILTLVKVPHNAENFLACAGSQEFTRKFVRLCRFPTIHTPILTPVQAPDNSHANPYACEGSQKC
ncbi:hypothetical protein O181_116625 [Austropuccinia psidii MF-1]|uniref:Tet-like 2OG-Fe(II) oxygenase domain-containing protein n=1 Tax=Austropuccinia psidii MF-1 TaxID=1389203 RepID=A0A9Q3KCT8_9BASI|nr:hypothetical protein [Austropuccinia psidii MF-1]